MEIASMRSYQRSEALSMAIQLPEQAGQSQCQHRANGDGDVSKEKHDSAPTTVLRYTQYDDRSVDVQS